MSWFAVLATAREDSGEYWFSRPSELVSPKRDYQKLAPLELSPRRLEFFLSEECSRLGKTSQSSLSPRRALA